MTKEQLIKETASALSKARVLELAAAAAQSEDSVAALIDLSFFPEEQVAFRSAWILESVFNLHPGMVLRCSSDFLSRYPHQNNMSCRRHFTNIMIGLTRPACRKVIDEPEPIIETTFQWLIDPETAVAVKCNCLDILYNLRGCSEWIADELAEQIVYLLKDAPASLQSRGKRVQKKLKSQKKLPS